MAEVGAGYLQTILGILLQAVGYLLCGKHGLRIRWKLTPLGPPFRIRQGFPGVSIRQGFPGVRIRQCFRVLSTFAPGKEVQGRVAEPDFHTLLAT